MTEGCTVERAVNLRRLIRGLFLPLVHRPWQPGGLSPVCLESVSAGQVSWAVSPLRSEPTHLQHVVFLLWSRLTFQTLSLILSTFFEKNIVYIHGGNGFSQVITLVNGKS